MNMKSKISAILNFALTCFLIVDLSAQSPAKIQGGDSKAYNPTFWLEGITSPRQKSEGAGLKAVIDEAARNGWGGVLYWGADRNGAEINYFYKSPFLEKQDWAVFKNDGLTPLVREAHDKGLKVMINIEGINPYHWKENRWTRENIKSVAIDLAASGVDAVFEECFEVKSDVFLSLAKTLRENGVNYISGTDPMLLREANFASLWPQTGTIDVYNYYLKRDKIFNIATLTQHGSLGYGWARYWKKPTSLISPLNRNWGIPTEYSPAVVTYLCMIRALQFRLDDFIIFGGRNKFDPTGTKNWIKEYVDLQEKERPLMNIVVLLKKQIDYSGFERGSIGWNRLFNSGDAITSGAMNAGYDIVVSDKVLPADAYWIYAEGGAGDFLPADVVSLFDTDKPVFLQAGSAIPGGDAVTPGWRKALEKCGIDGAKKFTYSPGVDSPAEVSLPENQEEDVPYTGYYKNIYLRFTGSDVQRGIDLRAGTIIPKEAIHGTLFASPNSTYGKGPYIVGKGNKYVVTPTALNWEVAYPISNLLSGSGILPSSNVWGIAGKDVCALLAIETTELEMVIPGLTDGSRLHVVVWDKLHQKKTDENVIY
jgi:hypothetical protein